MRILFSSLGSPGHTYPLIPLARAAVAAGHEVLFATSAELHPVLADAGCAVAEAGEGLREAFFTTFGSHLGRSPQPPPTLPDTERELLYAKAFGDVLPRAFLAGLLPLIERDRPDLVVHEAGNPGAALAGKHAGVPTVCHAFGLAPIELGPGFAEALHAVAADAGVTLPSGPALGTAGDPYLDLCPPSLQRTELAEAVPAVALRPAPFAPPAQLPAVVRDRVPGRPLVYLTLGTVIGAADVLRAAADGLSALDADILVATGPSVSADVLGDLPPNVTVQPWVPQADVIPLADLVVHHGGFNTTLTALAAAVPQVVLPSRANAFDGLDRIAASGAVEHLPPDTADGDAVADAAARVLAGPGYAAAARKLAEEIAAMPSADDVAARLPALAAGQPVQSGTSTMRTTAAESSTPGA
ncbi:glycosyltransferase [Amycolatopsis suaedae]|uniref:Glycosyltransferase n=1 Tax=Amycolatopsis suaedae TaxID=2510978 RepID=A0A4Q7J228_9PSEU|nr:nucleotide disphospho-sugar-binding domain-containing protein [Amycolatopsis suaedae]RZQ60927.1 glycosyltransferase [Amycolatopsis suaedae]